MSEYADLFKSELSAPEDKVLIDCPHCAKSITRGQVLKAAKKGSRITMPEGSDDHSDDEGGPLGAMNDKTPARSGEGVPEESPAPKARISNKAAGEPDVKKSDAPRVIGSAYCRMIESPLDKRIAEMEAQGGSFDARGEIPIDRNQSRSRLLTP